ncbi:putative molybdenum ABC transporter, ATP-binding protein [Methylococcus capsulatus str. Bath]|uniref:Putative molybdenum ABC transporter, ATP-binding protein n=1 Tax=Methylococcus capsulatus (strain ATCC 33009 / NCIMB 11132 / Bath) TaxID=243233 RepID=Q603H0_METCA|nr:ATP-binding cassette domain-containing protein [Methylococcus capsulatus]AAU91146.1 putative molybdenum ABC transporter, ATP-binding protein [Methylococcus capsulatus str. Bath]
MLELDVKLSRGHFDLSARLAIDSPMTACFGPPGAGKSTLLGMIAGVVMPQRGWIRLGGETVFDSRRGVRMPAGRRRIGLVRFDPASHPRQTVGELLRDTHRNSVRSGTFGFAGVVDLLELEPLLDSGIQSLPAGDRQRVALAHALIPAPRLLLLDDQLEVSGVSNSALLPYLTRIRDELNVSIIYVSHSLGEVLQLTNRMVLMVNGRVLGFGDPHEIITDKILSAGAPLQGIENVLPVTVLGHEAENGCTIGYYHGSELVLPMAAHLAPGDSVDVSIRSSDIALSKQYLRGTSIQNQIKGRLCAVIRTPGHAVVQIDCGITLLAGISLKALHAMALREGDTVYCLIKAHAFSYLGNPSRDGQSLDSREVSLVH